MLDVVIIGGGPAGLSAALVLARCRRDILVIDAGEGRNKRASEIHGYLTRDCTPPDEFLSLARAEALKYGAAIADGFATHARKLADGTFAVRFRKLAKGATPPSEELEITCRRLLLATGMRDILPSIDGLIDFYGSSVHHCPYCDGWEHRDRRLVAYGKGNAAIGLALALRTWSPRVTACTDGETTTDEFRRRAAVMNIQICDLRVSRLEGKGAELQRVVVSDGTPIDCDALFFNTGQNQRSDLPRLLGCTFKPDGGVETPDRQCTSVAGLYLAGDADKEVQFVITAASEGATAAVAINRELQEDDQARASP